MIAAWIVEHWELHLDCWHLCNFCYLLSSSLGSGTPSTQSTPYCKALCLRYLHGATHGQARSIAGVFFQKTLADAVYCFIICIKVDVFAADATLFCTLIVTFTFFIGNYWLWLLVHILCIIFVKYTVSQKTAHLWLDAREPILILFGRNATDKVSSQKMLYCATSNNLCFCITWQNGKYENYIFHSLY